MQADGDRWGAGRRHRRAARVILAITCVGVAGLTDAGSALASTAAIGPSLGSGVSVTCAPSTVLVGQPTTCTLSVRATRPFGIVTFARTSTGTFSAPGCLIGLTSASRTSCSVTYTPTAVGGGAQTITATYLGTGPGIGRASTTVTVSTPPPPNAPAVAYQLNPAHTGVVGDAIAASPTQRWAVNLGGPVSYPLIVGGRVFITVADTASYGSKLYALDAATGATDWGPVELGGTYGFSGIAYDGGDIYAVNFDGVLQAFDAATGTHEWTLQLPGQYAFTSPPTATGGVVYVGGAGSGGTVYAVSEATHAVLWTGSVANGDHSSPAVSATGVYVSYACGQTYDFAPATGALIWHRSTGCEGGGGKTPVLANGRLYVRDFLDGAVLDAGTGAVLGPFAAQGPAPAVDATSTYTLGGSTLTAAAITSSAEEWTFSGDGLLSTAPVVAAGSVLVGSQSGNLYALSRTTGAVTWSANVGSPILAPDEQNADQLTGLATSGGLIVVPATDELVAYK